MDISLPLCTPSDREECTGTGIEYMTNLRVNYCTIISTQRLYRNPWKALTSEGGMIVCSTGSDQYKGLW